MWTIIVSKVAKMGYLSLEPLRNQALVILQR
jgi:hypothetical protein